MTWFLWIVVVSLVAAALWQRRTINRLREFDPYVARNVLQHYDQWLRQYGLSARIVYDRGYWNFTARWGDWQSVSLNAPTVPQLYNVIDAWFAGLVNHEDIVSKSEEAEEF